MCYFCCSACISPHSCFWPCSPCIMNYQLYMTHGLTTVNRHDHAWTDKWAPNIAKLSRQMSLMRLRGERRQHGRTRPLYETKGAWKNSPTRYALLNVGFMAILRREHIYILIWACNPASPNSYTVIFQNCSSSKTKTTQNENVVLFCCHEYVLETMSVVLHGRSHPAQGSRVRGSQGPYGFKGTTI